MESYKDIIVGDKYILPKGQEFFSIALQENVISTRDLIILATNKVAVGDDGVFGNIQIKFENYPMRFLIGDAAIGYSNKVHGDITVSYKQLKPIK